MKIKSMNKECSESIIRYSSALKENNVLKTKLVIILFKILIIKQNQKILNLVKFLFRTK